MLKLNYRKHPYKRGFATLHVVKVRPPGRPSADGEAVARISSGAGR